MGESRKGRVDRQKEEESKMNGRETNGRRKSIERQGKHKIIKP